MRGAASENTRVKKKFMSRNPGSAFSNMPVWFQRVPRFQDPGLEQWF